MTEVEGYIPVAINSRIETEEVLGPLPDGWEKAQWGTTHRFYFVDHNIKQTTWIDPRTYHLRKHDIRDIVAGELPYGWEECFDEVCGIYYIDHLTQSHFLDAPWDPAVRDQVLALREHLADEAKKLEDQIELERQKKQELDEAEAKVNELEDEKRRLEQEINGLHERDGVDPETGAAYGDERHELEEELEAVKNKLEIERLEAEQVAQEHSRLQTEIQDFQSRLAELRSLNEKLDTENKALRQEAQATNDELAQIRNLIEMEAAQRAALEAHIKQLKSEMLIMVNPDEARALEEKEQAEEAAAEEIEIDAPLPEPGTLDMEAELAALKERLEEEKKERDRLKEITANLEAERNRAQDGNNEANPEGLYRLPEWIRELNINAQKSKTLRVKIAKSAANPDQLGFREKLAKFAAASIEAQEGPKLPEGPTKPKSEFAVRARETAFGRVDEEIDPSSGLAIPLEQTQVDKEETIQQMATQVREPSNEHIVPIEQTVDDGTGFAADAPMVNEDGQQMLDEQVQPGEPLYDQQPEQQGFEGEAQPVYEQTEQPALDDEAQPMYEQPEQQAFESDGQPMEQPAFEGEAQQLYEQTEEQPAFEGEAQPLDEQTEQAAFEGETQPMYEQPEAGEEVYNQTEYTEEQPMGEEAYVPDGEQIQVEGEQMEA